MQTQDFIQLISTFQKTKPFAFIDLFCGLGSFRLGFESYGAQCVFSSDINKKVDAAYFYAHGDRCLNDIINQPIEEIPEFDILCAGFPCQPFSHAGKQLAFDDPRALTVFKTVDIIKKRQPKAFVLENVKGIKTYSKSLKDTPLNVLRSMLSDCGYDIHVMLLNACTHAGLPQNRERFFFIGYRNDLNIKTYQNISKIQCLETYKHYLQPSTQIESKYYYIEKDRPRLKWVFRYLNEFAQASDCDRYVYQIRGSSGEVRKHKVAGRVPALIKRMGTGGNNVPLIYDAPSCLWRRLTPRECLSLQGYPLNFPVNPSLSDSAIYSMAGNTIPLNLSKRIAFLVLSTLASI